MTPEFLTKISEIVGSICNDLGIPHFITHWIPGEEQNTVEHHKYTRNFFPENNMYARALGKVIDDANWNGFTLIYDNKECKFTRFFRENRQMYYIVGKDDQTSLESTKSI